MALPICLDIFSWRCLLNAFFMLLTLISLACPVIRWYPVRPDSPKYLAVVPPPHTPCRSRCRRNLSWCASHHLLHSHRGRSPTSDSQTGLSLTSWLFSDYSSSSIICTARPLVGTRRSWSGDPPSPPHPPSPSAFLGICPGTLQFISHYSTGNDLQSKLLSSLTCKATRRTPSGFLP